MASVIAPVKVTPAAVFAFDLVALGSRDLRALPLLTRKELLKDMLKDSTRICYTQHVGKNGVRLYQMAAESTLGNGTSPSSRHWKQSGKR
jgi:ATP-dependent DNA ligase